MKIFFYLLFLWVFITCSYADVEGAARRGKVEEMLWSSSFQPSREEFERWQERMIVAPGIKEDLMAIVIEGSEGKGNYETIGKAFHVLRFRKDVTERDEESLVAPLRKIANKEGRWTPYDQSYAAGGVRFINDHYSRVGESILIDLVERNEGSVTEAVQVLGERGSEKAIEPLEALKLKYQPNPDTDEDIHQLADEAIQRIERRTSERGPSSADSSAEVGKAASVKEDANLILHPSLEKQPYLLVAGLVIAIVFVISIIARLRKR